MSRSWGQRGRVTNPLPTTEESCGPVSCEPCLFPNFITSWLRRLMNKTPSGLHRLGGQLASLGRGGGCVCVHGCTAHTQTSVDKHTHADTVTWSPACSGPPSADIHTTYTKPPGLFTHVHPESRLQHPPGDTKLSLLPPLTFSCAVRQVGPQADPQCAVRS